MTADLTDIALTSPDFFTSPPPEKVIRLVGEVLDGNKEATEKFYVVFGPLVKGIIGKWNTRYFRPLGLRALDGEDDTQNVMIRLIYGDRFAGGFHEHESPLKKWLTYEGERRRSLYKFVDESVNWYLRDLRRRKNPADPVKSVNPSKPDGGHYLEAMNERAESLTVEERQQLRRCTRKCWLEMNPSYREALELVRVMGLSQAESALRLGVSEATMSRWMNDATEKLRDCLIFNCPEELLPFEA